MRTVSETPVRIVGHRCNNYDELDGVREGSSVSDPRIPGSVVHDLLTSSLVVSPEGPLGA